MLAYNRANREVAILCNHQRTVSKSHETQVGKLDEVIGGLEDELKQAKAELKAAVRGGVARRGGDYLVGH